MNNLNMASAESPSYMYYPSQNVFSLIPVSDPVYTSAIQQKSSPTFEET